VAARQLRRDADNKRQFTSREPPRTKATIFASPELIRQQKHRNKEPDSGKCRACFSEIMAADSVFMS
jgi:hypothetical protein